MKKTVSNIWSILNSNFVLLIIGFILTSVAGTYLNNLYQQATWEREKRFEILTRNLDEGTKFIEKLSDLMNRRFFGLQRVIWAAESKDKNKLLKIWDDYYGSVIEWNQQLNANHSRIERLSDVQLANYFMLAGDEFNGDNPLSIHGKFRIAHQRVLLVRKCVLSNCDNIDEKISFAHSALTNLDINIDKFIFLFTDVFVRQAEKLEDLPKSNNK